MQTKRTNQWITTAGTFLTCATLGLLPGRLVAQDAGPAPAAEPATAPPAAAELEGRRSLPVPERRTRSIMPTRAPGTAVPGFGGSSRLVSAASSPPVGIAPARFEAAVYEVQVPANRVDGLDALALEAQAATTQALATALASFGETRLLYKIDQSVNLYGESITLGTSEPMVTSTRRMESGPNLNSVSYQDVGLVVNISATAPPADSGRQGLDTQISFSLATLVDSGVEIGAGVKAPSVRKVQLGHSETPRFGHPCIQLSVSAPASGSATLSTAYVIRYRFSEVPR